MVDGGEDFLDYIKAERDMPDNEILRNHDIWLKTSWSGFLIRKVRNFVQPISEELSSLLSDEDSISSALILNLLRIMAILTVAVFVVVVGKIIQRFIGSELYVEQEIVILHEYETAEEKRIAETRSKEGRGKKEKRQ